MEKTLDDLGLFTFKDHDVIKWPADLPDVAILCRKCLMEYQSGKINEAEFDRRLAVVTVKYCLEDMRERPLPAIPQEVNIYRRCNALDKQKMLKDYPDFFRMKEVAKFYDDEARVLNQNLRNFERLKELKKYIKKPENIKAINKTLDTYTLTQERLAVRDDGAENEPDVDSIIQSSGGRVTSAIQRHDRGAQD